MIALILSAVATAPLGHCPAERAIYKQRGTADLTAHFMAVESGHNWPSRLVLRLQSGKGGFTSWWLPYGGGSSEQQFLASTTDTLKAGWSPPSPDDARQRPLGDMRYVGMDSAYGVLADLPRKGQMAPAHILLPDMREVSWYRVPDDKRTPDSKQMFYLIRCAPA